MANRSMLWAALAGSGLAALGCAGPLLVGAIGVSALLALGTHFILPAAGLLIVTAALVLYSRFRRTRVPSACCDDRPATPARNLR